MATNRLLIEIGVEELPASYIKPAAQGFAKSLAEALRAERLLESNAVVETRATPRRLMTYIEGLSLQQSAACEDLFGPPLKAAKDGEGQWSKAALGFAKKNDVSVDSLSVQKDEKGIEKLFISKQLPQSSASDVLSSLLPELIRTIKTPKTMRFVPFAPLRFARPIRWLVALLNKDVISFDLDGIASGRTTYGHRFATHNESLELPGADLDFYERQLTSLRVISDPEKRKKVIRNLLEDATKQLTESPDWDQIMDEALLETVTYCVEWPDIVVGEFNHDFLTIPKDVPITSMKHHQKYFPVIDCKKGLLPQFLSITNGVGCKDNIATGNERVIAARLADAVFFWKEDLKKTLEQRYPDLKAMTYHKDIGSYYDKTEATRKLGQSMAETLSWPQSKQQLLDRAIMLSKVDLLTNMVYEFPELQGLMGGEYAHIAQEPSEVIKALQQQYSLEPVEGDVANMLIAADRLDTLQQAFRIGTKVTGSSDPYGLRRAALTLIQVLHQNAWPIVIEGEV